MDAFDHGRIFNLCSKFSSNRRVSDGAVDIAMVSNKVEDASLNSEIFAIDGIAIIVNKENDLINDLNISELRSIYKGDIKNTGELRK